MVRNANLMFLVRLYPIRASGSAREKPGTGYLMPYLPRGKRHPRPGLEARFAIQADRRSQADTWLPQRERELIGSSMSASGTQRLSLRCGVRSATGHISDIDLRY